jgi:hypothetical protein
MVELLSLLIASFLATSIGIGVLTARGKVQDDRATAKMNAKLDFKHAENRADADYKIAISVCKKKSPPDKMRCLDDAKNVNARLLLAAKEKMDKVVTEAAMPKESQAGP